MTNTANGNSMNLGGGASYGLGKPGEVTREPGTPPSVNWEPTAVLMWRI
jgi:hypothetical protein